MSTALAFTDIPWTAAVDEPPIVVALQPGRQADVPGAESRRPLKWHDLVITELADGEAAALARVAELTDALEVKEREHAWTAEALRVAVGMLARVTYERDMRLASQYRQAGVSMAPDGVEAAV